MTRTRIPAVFAGLDLPPLESPRTIRTVLAGVREKLARPLRRRSLARELGHLIEDVGVLTLRREDEWSRVDLDGAEVTSILLRQKHRRYRLVRREWDALNGKEGDTDGC